MYQQDTILRQIEMLTQALARIFFRKEKVVYEFPEQETGYSDDDVWYARILRLLASSEINAAEDALFDGFDASSVRLRAALDFYSRLTKRLPMRTSAGRRSHRDWTTSRRAAALNSAIRFEFRLVSSASRAV